MEPRYHSWAGFIRAYWPLTGVQGSWGGSYAWEGNIYIDGGSEFHGWPDPGDANYVDIVLHEYGHAAMYHAYGGWTIPGSGGPHYYGESYNTGLAWSEGWATFFALSVNPDGYFNSNGSIGYVESPPYWYAAGDECEAQVAAALYDLYDSSSDGLDVYSGGFSDPWDIVWDRNSPHFRDFWDEWVNRNLHPYVAIRSVYQNTIDYRNGSAQNLSFEDVSGSDIVGWTPYGSGSFSSSSIAKVGSKSAKISRTSSSGSFGYTQHYVACNPNTTYYLRGWIKTAATSSYANLSFGVWDSNPSFNHHTDFGHVSGTSDWTYVSGSWTSGPTEITLAIKIYGYSTFIGDAYFDALYFGTSPPKIVAPMASKGEEKKPGAYELSENYPNPFNPRTTIKFALPEAGQVKLSIYDALGQEIATLANGFRDVGYYSVVWNGRDRLGSHVASGLYFYRLEAQGVVKTKKMLLLR